MPRLLCIAVSVLAGILPVSVFALSLGEIQLKSALNQPFLAEIPVTSDTTDDLSGLKVSVAPAETFERFGLLRPAFLSDFELRVLQERGRQLIRVSSDAPIVEPFVTLLLEIKWPQGRLLREYTVLLDPPVFDSSAPAAEAAPAAPARPAAAPRQVQRAAEPAPGRPASPRAATSPMPLAGDSYGPVQRNETLWSIAERVRPDATVDMNQLMLAIYRANPDAFAGNINRLQAGAILRMPDASALAAVDRREAFAEVRRQNEAWRGAADTAVDEPARLRLVPPADEAGEAAAGGEQRRAAVGTAGDGTMQARVDELESQLAERDRLLELRDRELQDLQNQLEALRERQAEMRDEAPVMETDFEAEPEQAEPVAGAVEPTPEPEVPAEPETEAAAEATAGAEPSPATVPPAVTRAATASDEPSFIGQLFGSIWFYLGIAGVLAVIALFVVRGRRNAAATAAGRWDELLDEEPETSPGDTSRLAAAAAERPEEETIVVEEPAEPATDKLDELPLASSQLDRAGDEETPLERTLSSEAALNLDQADPIAEAEFHVAYGLYDQAADLLQEALRNEPDRRDLRRKLIDVYFVWENRGGFLREAEAFKDAVGADDPEWNKVLIMGKQLCPEEELFAGTPSGVAGDEAMDLSLDEGLADSADVDLQLGDDEGEVDLDLSAIREGPSATGGLDFDLSDIGGDVEDLPADDEDKPRSEATVETPTLESPGPSSPTVETPTLETPSVEPTMETPTIQTRTGEFGSAEQGSGDETAALDLDELGLDLDEFADVAGDLADSDADLDNDSETDDVGAQLDEIASAMEKGASEIGDTVDQPGAGTDETAEQPRGAVEETAEQPRPEAPGEEGTDKLQARSPDLGGIDLDIGDALGADNSPTGTMGGPKGGGELPTMTEVGTKLDLARAYLDMGDPDGAKSILDEVVEEGDETQREEAQQLLSQLST